LTVTAVAKAKASKEVSEAATKTLTAAASKAEASRLAMIADKEAAMKAHKAFRTATEGHFSSGNF